VVETVDVGLLTKIPQGSYKLSIGMLEGAVEGLKLGL